MMQAVTIIEHARIRVTCRPGGHGTSRKGVFASSRVGLRRQPPSLLTLASSFPNPPTTTTKTTTTILTIGEALYDCLASDADLGVSDVDKVSSWTPYPGGAPANVATALARLSGAEKDDNEESSANLFNVAFLTALGNDGPGDEFLELLATRGVDTSYVQRKGLPTREVLVTRDLSGDRTFAGFRSGGSKTMSSGGYADCEIRYDDFDKQLGALGKSDGADFPFDVCVMGTLGLAYGVTGETMRQVAKRMGPTSGGGKLMVIDVNWRPVFWEEYGADEAREMVWNFLKTYGNGVVKMTDEEVAWLFAGELGREEALEHPERVLAKLHDVKLLLVSAGEFGSSYAARSGSGQDEVLKGRVPVLKVDRIADTTGAGDAYLAGFLAFMLKNGGIDALRRDAVLLKSGVEFATACGAATCLRVGAIGSQPTETEALRMLDLGR